MFYEPNNFYNTVVRIWESESVFFFWYFYMQTCTGTYNVHATCIYFFTCLNLMFIFFLKNTFAADYFWVLFLFLLKTISLDSGHAKSFAHTVYISPTNIVAHQLLKGKRKGGRGLRPIFCNFNSTTGLYLSVKLISMNFQGWGGETFAHAFLSL